MRFKEFLLKENEDNYLEVKIGDILSALQNILEDSGVISKKDVNDHLVNIANRIKPLLNSGNKNYKILKTLQKVAVTIYSGVENGDDPKNVAQGCIAELEALLSGNGSAINKINKKETEGLPKPEDYSIKNDLKSSSKFLKQADQSNPGMETGVDNDKAPPLSGDGQRTLNVV
jgi:cell division protein YceG involved in septum cleavage